MITTTLRQSETDALTGPKVVVSKKEISAPICFNPRNGFVDNLRWILSMMSRDHDFHPDGRVEETLCDMLLQFGYARWTSPGFLMTEKGQEWLERTQN